MKHTPLVKCCAPGHRLPPGCTSVLSEVNEAKLLGPFLIAIASLPLVLEPFVRGILD